MTTKYCLICGEIHSRIECPPLQACETCGDTFYSYAGGNCFECAIAALGRSVNISTGPEIETCMICGEYHDRPQCAPVLTCECGKQFRSYIGTKCMACLAKDIPGLIRKVTFGGGFANQHAAPPKRQAVPDAFYRAFRQ